MAVWVIGSVNVDVILPVAALPRAGETVLAGDVARLPGGKGANQAVAAARMGAATRFAGAVGADEAGGWMRGVLAGEGIDLSALATVEGRATGTAYIAVDAAGENQIIVASGANHAPDLPVIAPPEGDILLAQLELPVAALASIFAEARGRRIINAAPALPDAAALFAHADVLIVNQHELAFYVGAASIDGPRDALAARALIVRDEQVVIVTLGAGGALAVWRNRAFHAPALPVTPIDTVGAGDCFCGALAALLDQGLAIEAALPLANAAAALCTQERGAVPAMPYRAAVEAVLQGQPTDHARAIKNRGAVLLG
jgi:ribokinase